MDFIKFVNSKDIRKYLYDIDYKLSGEQKLFLIENCYRIPLKEKLKAFKVILNEPDENVLVRKPVFFKNHNLKNGDLEKESLHELTQNIIKKDATILENFLREENNCYYEVKVLQDGVISRLNFTTARLSSLETAFQWYRHNYTLEDIKNVDIVQITKNYIFDKPDEIRYADKYIEGYFNSNLKLLRIFNYAIKFEEPLLSATTEKLLVHLPMPFKQGDILERKKSGIMTIWQSNAINEPFENGMPFVFESSTPDDTLSKGECMYDIKFKGFYFDKNRQYILNCDGYEHTYDLEYYRKPLEGKERFLKILSMKLKDKASVPDEAVRMAYEYCRTLAMQKELEDTNECFEFDIMKYLSDDR